MMRRMQLGPDVLVGAVVILMVLMMIVPLPTFVLSLLIVSNLALSVTMVLLAMYIPQPLDFSGFPSLLLLATLYRLSLNISTARLILLRGNAGAVVQAFGSVVVGGNPLVGFIVFLILVIVQFIVITRGAERVAEVAARFTLDAMPGKQMAIDADLNAGLIDEQKARARRAAIEGEADFYGAMDGASKFVKGDAIAALLIIAINIIGGLIVGILQRHMTLGAAVRHYTLLTVGDGLTAQIPALLISTATGIIVTRAAAADNLGQQLSAEFLAQPRVLWSAAMAVALVGLMPGLPKVIFFGLAAAVAGVAYLAQRRSRSVPPPASSNASPQPAASKAALSPVETLPLLDVDPLGIELGYGLLRLAEGSGGGELMERVAIARRQIALDLGIVLPLVRVRDSMELPPNTYSILLRGSEVARGELRMDAFLAMRSTGATDEIPGVPTRDPAFGLPALWISPGDRARAELAGFTIVDPPTVLATHFSEVCKSLAAELLSRQECKSLLDLAHQRHPSLVDDLVPGQLSLGQVQRVLQNLLREGVSIRNLIVILEALSDAAATTKDVDALTERARAALAREITRSLEPNDRRLQVLSLDPELEGRLGELASGAGKALDGAALRALRHSVEEGISACSARGRPPVVLTTPAVRPVLRRLTERAFPQLRIVSTSELAGDVQIESLGRLRA